MRARLVPLAIVLVAALTLASVARADGDPASDYLVSQQVFLSSDAKIPSTDQQKLLAAVASANQRGYPLKVALIWSSYDLGSVPELFGNPRTYARFLDAEDAYWFKTKTHLLVVMPKGLGYAQWKHSPAPGYRTISGVRVEPTPAGLATAATTAVEKLAAAAGVKVSTSSTTAHLPVNRNNQDRIEIVVAVAAALVLGAAARLAIRRRAARSAPR